MRNPSFSVLQMCILLMLSVGLVNHVTIIPLLLHTAHKDSWISVIFAVPLCILWSFAPYYIAKKLNGTNLIQWLKTNNQSWLAFVTASLLFTYLFCNSYLTFREVLAWTKITYLPQTPVFVSGFTLMLVCVYAAIRGIKAISVAGGVLLPFVILLGYFVMSSNFQVKRYELLLPLFTSDSASIIRCMVFVFSSSMEFILIVLLQQHMSKIVKWWQVIILVIMILGLTLGPLMGSIAAFGYEAEKLKYPAFEQWRLVQLGAFVSHVDFLSIYQWISGAFIRISLSLYLMIDILQMKSKKLRNFGYIAAGVVHVVMITFLNITDVQYSAILKTYYRIVFYCIFPLSFLLLAVVFIKTRKKEADL
ncbi:endospore germination permease [Paenibacillus thalictri]|uniref:Spore gernimation protein n=1 Tax=Paenibacillus thalictri TaxID=2527873 RepID=A0A4Q9DYU2_9BACL|nr:endospore germination permease [Paenibacillus thalictri]TBL80410.1 spore gernimation protein [Paenibacillus thalictri]